MYGLLLENLSEYVKTVYGEDKWEDIRRQAGVDSPSFSVHQVYPENLLNKLAKKAQQILNISEREFMDQMGVYFVSFVGQYGYDRVLSVLGRHMRDFLNGLDNLHEYLKFSYPRMRAPSFICENETKQGLTLHYRSKRRGFVYYTMGQIREVARHFYHKEMHIELVREEILFDTVHVTFQLTFDNRAFTLASLAMTREEKHLPISAHVLFEIFPFCIVFGSDMIVRSIGNSLMVILPELCGKKITAWFDLVRPLIAFKFQTILNRTNNIFELVTVEPVTERIEYDKKNELLLPVDDGNEPERSLRLKGQMIYMDNWRMIMFLGTPVMPDLTSLITTGLYINDLSMHDFSRDLMLAGTQQSVELKLALDQEQQKSKKLEESMRKLDEEMRRTDELLYQMIPKQVADRLRKGENPIDTCEMFDSVSILFSDVVTFTEICSRITPMEVVSMLNAMYSIFDTLTERNLVYKVETIGDAYMVVAGAPEQDTNHAEKVCDMALDMVDAITDLKDPSTGQHLRIRVGVHSGAVVAGIVGLKMPRYCLFGDSVNTASRMESTSAAMKIHVSESTKELLSPNYKLTERGEIDVKGKGTMKTYWLDERENRKSLQLLATQLRPIANFSLKKSKSKTITQRSSTIKKERIVNNVNIHSTKEYDKDESNVIITTTAEERSRIYSPVTFKDVARRSIANSPVRTSATKCLPLVQQQKQQEKEEQGCEYHSNSSSDQVYTHSQLQTQPSRKLNTLVLNTEEFLGDFKTYRESSTLKSPVGGFICPFNQSSILDKSTLTTHCSTTSLDKTKSENVLFAATFRTTPTTEKSLHDVKPPTAEANADCILLSSALDENQRPINEVAQNLEEKGHSVKEMTAITTSTGKDSSSTRNASEVQYSYHESPILMQSAAQLISNKSDKIIWPSKQITATFEKNDQSHYNTKESNVNKNIHSDIKDELNEVKELDELSTARPINSATPESTIYNNGFDYDTTANKGLSREGTTTAANRSTKLSLSFSRNRHAKKNPSRKDSKIRCAYSGETASGSNQKLECPPEEQHSSHHYHHQHRTQLKTCQIL